MYSFFSALFVLSMAKSSALPPVNQVIADPAITKMSDQMEITELEIVFKQCEGNYTAEYQEPIANGFRLFGNVVITGLSQQYDYKKAEYVLENNQCIFRAWND